MANNREEYLLVGGRLVRLAPNRSHELRCQNPQCGRFFRAFKASAKYCCTHCGNAARARVH
jgi:hypothetical protein